MKKLLYTLIFSTLTASVAQSQTQENKIPSKKQEKEAFQDGEWFQFRIYKRDG